MIRFTRSVRHAFGIDKWIRSTKGSQRRNDLSKINNSMVLNSSTKRSLLGPRRECFLWTLRRHRVIHPLLSTMEGMFIDNDVAWFMYTIRTDRLESRTRDFICVQQLFFFFCLQKERNRKQINGIDKWIRSTTQIAS